MSLIPDNVFDDAQVLHNTYAKLQCWAEQQPKGNGRKAGRIKARVKKAKKALRQIDRRLLFDLSVDVFQQSILLRHREYRVAHLQPEASPLFSRIFGLAGQAVPHAKRLAHLFVRSTTDNDHLTDDEADLCFDLLLHCFTEGRWYVVENQPLPMSSIAFLFLDRLVKSAEHGDHVSHDYLRLLYQALIKWRFDIQPISVLSYTQDHRDQYWASLGAGSFYKKEDESPLALPICYSLCHSTRLQKARADEIEHEFGSNWESLNEFWLKVSSIKFDAYERFMEALWSFVSRQENPNLVLAGGRDKVEIRIPYLRHSGFHSLAFTREGPDGKTRLYPEVGIRLFVENLCERTVKQIAFDSQGCLMNMGRIEWRPQFMAFFRCVLMDAYADIVVPTGRPGTSDDPRKRRRRLLKGHHSACEIVAVRAHFPRLPKGYEASQKQIESAIRQTGVAPPAGHTFKGEHVRGFPGVPLPYQEGLDAWRVHRDIAPSVVVTENHVLMLLEQIPNFA